MIKVDFKKQKFLFLIIGVILIALTTIWFHQSDIIISEQGEKIEPWLAQCIIDKQAQANFFNPGDLMINFEPSLDIKIAQNMLLAHGLITEDKFLLDWPWPYAAPGVLLINVPVGEEFKWMCLLEKEDIVIGVQLNQVAKVLIGE